MEAKLLEVNGVELTLLKNFPTQLSIVVFGSASTLGWTNTKLVPHVYITPPSDGFFEFDLVGTPPSGVAGEMITPIVISHVMTDIPAEFKGARVYASLNRLESAFT
ncbi:hypothetical protein F9L16_23325 [Agarivorans sp. B2Z047]|uniref:hypothetical protein n=1 Tax=Agarivorans sp. B2Z047 TaxID=2652721 RepID=UPI00128D61E6|nr:hypothetical protein [Agarivorans sp. B2Z047]MPW31891.1 hypothetical protein [Agarivorans sp. B2Z047]UQN40973.1 hypothetical protein LQZ07_14445 [Agarivorans sp. B2Z047]